MTTIMTKTAMMAAAATSQSTSRGRPLSLNAAVGNRFMSRPSSTFSSSPVLSPRESNREKEEEDEKVEKEDFTVHILHGYVNLIVLYFIF